LLIGAKSGVVEPLKTSPTPPKEGQKQSKLIVLKQRQHPLSSFFTPSFGGGRGRPSVIEIYGSYSNKMSLAEDMLSGSFSDRNLW